MMIFKIMKENLDAYRSWLVLLVRPEFFYKLIYGNCFSDLGSGGTKKK